MIGTVELNENTYSYIDRVFFQLEGITCALATFFENNRAEVSSYHYKVLNDTYNDMRNEFVDTVKWITDDFDSVKKTALKMVDMMKGAEESKTKLEASCSECDSCISRLIIRCSNIELIDDSTENPWIPNSDEDVYNIFSGYKRLLDDYPIQYPDNDDDVISNLFFSFYKACNEKFDALFKEYNELLEQVGISVETKKLISYKVADDAAKQIVKKDKKSDAIKDIVGSAASFGVTMAEALVPAGIAAAALSSAPLAGIAAVGIASKAATSLGIIEKKDLGDVAIEGIGLIATISEKMQDIIPGDEDNKSMARNMLRRFEAYNQAIKIVDEASGVFDSGTTSAEKLIFGTVLATRNADQIDMMIENGTADVLTSGLSLTSGASKTIQSIIKGDYKSAVLSGLQIPNKALNLFEDAAKCVKKNEMPDMVPIVGKMLYKYGQKLGEYEESIKRFEYNKARDFPALKPRKPLWVLESGSEIIGFISEKIDKNGDDIIEFIKSVL